MSQVAQMRSIAKNFFMGDPYNADLFAQAEFAGEPSPADSFIPRDTPEVGQGRDMGRFTA